MKFKRTRICAAVLTGLTGLSVGTGALAQERIEITGSAIKRVDAEGALPVQVITREDIARGGYTSTEDLLQAVSSISSAGGRINAAGVGDSTYGRSTISLRGLGEDRTLVLVNGRRVAPAAGGGGATVNVNNIPLAAVERVEILKDGASSIYGSEALAGVVNFILTKNFQGIEVGVEAGRPTRSGGGQSTKATIVAGFGDLSADGFNITGSLALEREKALFGRDRKFAAKADQPPFLFGSATGQGNIQGGWVRGTGSVAAGNWVQGTGIDGFAGGGPGGSYGNPLAASNRCEDIRMFNAGNVGKVFDDGPPEDAGAAALAIANYCQFDSGADVGLIPKREAVSLTLNGAFRLNAKTELFGDLLFSKSKVTQTFQASPVRNSFLVDDAEFLKRGVDPVLLLNPSNPNYAIAAAYLNRLANAADPTFGLTLTDADGNVTGKRLLRDEILAIIGQPLAITARVFDFGPRSSSDETTQTRLVGGVRGEIADQSYEVAISTNKNKLAGKTISGYFSQVEYARAVSASNDWNPWSLTQSAAFQQSIAPSVYVGPTLRAATKSTIIDGKLTGDLVALPAGPLQYALGTSYRKENYELDPSEALLSGDISGLGGAVPPVDRDRNIASLFAEGIVPIIKGLEGSAAYRYDRYNDVGGASTYKGSLRWQPTKQILVRAGLGTGFRAPTLSELWYPQVTGTSEQFIDPRFPGSPQQARLTTGGNPNLKPEESKQRSIGLVIQPFEALTVGIDYWKIKVDKIISTPSTQEVVSRFRAGDPAFAGLVTLNSSGQVDVARAINANVGKADVEGVDIDANLRLGLPVGRMDVALNGTYMIKFDQTSPAGTISRKVGTIFEDTVNSRGARVGIPVLGADEGGVVLRWKHRLAATYALDGWAVTLAQNYYSGYRTADRQYDEEKNFVKAQALYDLNVTYSGIKGLRLAVGVRNLFDKDPPIFVPASNQFQNGYDAAMYDPRARFVYVSGNYKF